MNLVPIVIGFLLISVVAGLYVQRQSFLAVGRLFDHSGPIVHGWLNPSVEGEYMGHHVRCAYDPSSQRMKKVYSIAFSTSVPWSFRAKQKNFLTELRRELNSTDQSATDEVKKPYGFKPLAFPEPLLSDWLRYPEAIDAMDGLFAQNGVETLKLGNRVLTATLVQKVKQKWKPENVEDILRKMLTLVRLLEASR